MTGSKLPLLELFMLLFTLAGPIKMIPVFQGVAARLEPEARRGFAIRAALFAFLGVILAALMGGMQLQKVGVSREALGTAAGLVLAIVGLMPLVGLDKKPVAGAAPPDALGFAFPGILAPHTFGLIILYSLFARSQADTIGIILTGGALMLINLLAMLASGWIMGRIGMTPLRVFGAVFGIVQLALGIQILFWGLTAGLGGSAA